MITKAEWQEWKGSKITQKLVELLNIGSKTAIEDLLAMRGEIGDLPRGSMLAYEEALEIIRNGDGIYSEGE